MNATLSLLCVSGCALGMLLIAIVLMHHKRSQANWLLVGLVAIACIDLLFSAAEHLSQPAPATALLHLTGFPGLLFAPLLYLYLAAEISGREWQIKDTWHVASFILVQSLAIFEFATRPAMHWAHATGYLSLACVPVIGTYTIVSVRIVESSLLSHYPCSLFRGRSFVIAALFAALASYLFKAVAGSLISESGSGAPNIADVILSCSLVVLACSALYRTASRKHDAPARATSSEANPDKSALQPKRIKYGNNRLPDFLRKSIIAELNHHMQSARPWLKIDLTLSQLAASINVNPHHLSQIINSEFGKSFASYINEHRVNAACRLLSDRADKTVLDVAFDSGFASKSSFNALFKKHTGMTPSEYRRRFQKSDSLVA